MESRYWRVCGCRDVITNDQGQQTCCAEEGDVLTYELVDNYPNFSRCFTSYQPFCTMFDGDKDCDIDLKDFSVFQRGA